MTNWIKMPLLTDGWSTGSATGVTWRSGNVLSNRWNLKEFTEWEEPILPTVEAIQADDGEYLTGDDSETLTED